MKKEELNAFTRRTARLDLDAASVNEVAGMLGFLEGIGAAKDFVTDDHVL